MAEPRSPSPTTHNGAPRGASAVLGVGTRVRGRVTGHGDLTVLGDIEGEVRIRGELVVAEGGRVVSDVDADALRVSGSLEGNATVTGDVTVAAGARVRGDIRGATICIDEGADFHGHLDSEFTLPRELAEGPRPDDDGPTVRR